jgi:hypothetical protein
MWTRKVEVEAPHWGLADEPALVCSEANFAQAFHYWRGASGRRYLHSVYSLIGCPALPRANYILVRRYQGAKCGANEVHIHLLAETAEERGKVEADLLDAHTRRLATADAA